MSGLLSPLRKVVVPPIVLGILVGFAQASVSSQVNAAGVVANNSTGNIQVEWQASANNGSSSAAIIVKKNGVEIYNSDDHNPSGCLRVNQSGLQLSDTITVDVTWSNGTTASAKDNPGSAGATG